VTRSRKTSDLVLKMAATIAILVAIVLWAQRHQLEIQLRKLESERQRLAEQLAALAARRRARLNETRREANEVPTNDSSHFSADVAAAIGRLEDPRFANLGKARVDSNYAPLFRKLGLPEEKLEQLRLLLAERLRVVPEALQLAMAEGVALDDLPDRKQIIDSGAEEIDAAISEELGPDDYAAFQDYQASLGARRYMIQPFATHLAFGSDALSDSQVDSLAAAASATDFGTNEIILRPPGPEIPAAMDLAVRNVLTPGQQQAYQEYKAVWAAQRLKARLDLDLYVRKQLPAPMTHAP